MISALRRFVFAIGALALLPAVLVAQQQETATVTGRVRNQDGVSLAYVDIRIPELNAGVITRDNGVYTIGYSAIRRSRPRSCSGQA